MKKYREYASRLTSYVLLTVALTVSSFSALATDYFSGKTIRIVVPFPSGGDADLFTRVLARIMAKHVPGNPTVIVENRTGAGGTIAVNYVYEIAKPDGLTILSSGSSTIAAQLVKTGGVRYDLLRFEYLGNAGPILQVVAARSNTSI
jgi:tripartite-type tricarboxylate transporter receptor subunit TctC